MIVTEKQLEELKKLSIADLLAMMEYFGEIMKRASMSQHHEYASDCFKIVQGEWSSRRTELFGRSE